MPPLLRWPTYCWRPSKKSAWSAPSCGKTVRPSAVKARHYVNVRSTSLALRADPSRGAEGRACPSQPESPRLALCSTAAREGGWVSGSSETKIYGKDVMVREYEE